MSNDHIIPWLEALGLETRVGVLGSLLNNTPSNNSQNCLYGMPDAVQHLTNSNNHFSQNHE